MRSARLRLRMKLRRMRRLASYPHLAALEVFLLPDRHDFLDPIDSKPACLERLSAMRRRDRDRYRRLADIDEPDSMLNRDTHNLPPLSRLTCELPHLAQRHRFVSLVLEPNHAPASVILPGHPVERHRRARAWVCDGAFERFEVDRPPPDRNRPDPWRVRPAADRRYKRDLVIVARTVIVLDVFLIHRKRDAIMMAAERRKILEQPMPNLADRRSLGKFAVHFGGA